MSSIEELKEQIEKYYTKHGLVEKNYLKLVITEDNKIGLSGLIDTSKEEIILPEFITVIRKNAFKNNDNVRTIIGYGVERIEEGAFENSRLRKIVIPNCAMIASNAFKGCYRLNIKESIIKADTIESNNDGLECNLVLNSESSDGMKIYITDNEIVNLTIEDRPVYKGMFRGHRKLRTITLINVGEIYGFAFDNCKELQSVRIIGNIKNIYDGAFSKCTELREINLTESEGLEKIYNGAFYNCAKLSSIELPRTVEAIGFRTFCNAGIQYIKIPSRLSVIGKEAFKNSELKQISIDKREQGYQIIKIEEGAFKDTKLEQIVETNKQGIRGLVGKDTYLEIGSRAFENCTELKEIDKHIKINSIGEEAFKNCEKYNKVGIKTDYDENSNETYIKIEKSQQGKDKGILKKSI